jgi:hypothetical protein
LVGRGLRPEHVSVLSAIATPRVRHDPEIVSSGRFGDIRGVFSARDRLKPRLGTNVPIGEENRILVLECVRQRRIGIQLVQLRNFRGRPRLRFPLGLERSLRANGANQLDFVWVHDQLGAWMLPVEDLGP